MNRTRLILLAGVAVVAALGLWLWLGKPAAVDMSAYAPADSLLYLEANNPFDVVDAIAGTQAWKTIGSLTGPLAPIPERPWLRTLIARTGIGSINSVILARAQVAVVLTDLQTAEEGDTLNIKPQGVLLIETHTNAARVKPAFEEALKTLAEKTYINPTLQRSDVNGVEFLEWVSPEGSRRIVGNQAGSLLVIGTNQEAVRRCLDAAKGQVPNLKNDPELGQARSELLRSGALTFGYVPKSSSARLLSVGLPALLGRAPGDSQFQRLIAGGAAKIFRSLAWGSLPYQTGIEDRYLLNLEAPVGARLKPAFQATSQTRELTSITPGNVHSVSAYNFVNPLDAWQSLNATVSSQVDALSTVVFSSLLKASLISYGIDDPVAFLSAVDGTLLTMKLDEFDERSILIAGIRNRSALRSLIQKSMTAKPNAHNNGSEEFEDSTGDLAAHLGNDFVVLGSPEDVRRYVNRGANIDSENLKRLTFFRSKDQHASIVTYTDDADRVRSFIASVLTAKGVPVSPTEQSENAISSLPYSVTETTLTEHRVERVTRSPLGQFSTLFPLLLPSTPSRTTTYKSN